MFRIRHKFAPFWMLGILILGTWVPVQADVRTACEPELADPWFNKISFSEIEKILRYSRIIDIQEMRSALKEQGKQESGTSPVALITFEGGVRAAFKPNFWNMADAEEGAYKISRRRLKSRQIPPTIQ